MWAYAGGLVMFPGCWSLLAGPVPLDWLQSVWQVGLVGAARGNSFCVDLVDANGVASWCRCSMRVESSLNIAGVRVSSPAKNCLMSTVGVSSSLSSIASSLAVDFIVGPYRILASSSRLAAICNPHVLASHPCW